MSTPTESTPTYLDQLPNEILTIISDYVVSQAYTPNPWLTYADCMGSLHNAWPESRYETFTKPYMHHCICFNGSAFNLKQIMDGFLLHPETRLWAQVLLFRYERSLLHTHNPFRSIKQEFVWMAEACMKLGLKVEDIELPVISRDGIAEEVRPELESDSTWPYKRLEFLAQVLHRVTKFCYYTDADWIWPFPTLYKKDLQNRALPADALESQSEDNNIMTEPASRTIITPVPSPLRRVDQYYMGEGYWHYKCQNPYQVLLPAFFLPNIRVIQCSNMLCLSGDEYLTHLGPDAPHPHTSPITTLHVTSSDIHLETFENFLRLPKALVECTYMNSGDRGMDACTMRDMGHLLSKHHSKSLEILTLDGTEPSEVFVGSSSPDGHYIAPERIGSLRHFVKLRVIKAPYWSLVSCIDWIVDLPEAESPSLLKVLPQSLEIIKVFLDEGQMPWLRNIKEQLKCMIQKKSEMYPRLTKVEVDIRYIARKEGPDWDCLYKSFIDYLAGLAMKENVRLIIH